MKFELSRQIFEKILKYHISWVFVYRSRFTPSGRTYRQTNM